MSDTDELCLQIQQNAILLLNSKQKSKLINNLSKLIDLLPKNYEDYGQIFVSVCLPVRIYLKYVRCENLVENLDDETDGNLSKIFEILSILLEKSSNFDRFMDEKTLKMIGEFYHENFLLIFEPNGDNVRGSTNLRNQILKFSNNLSIKSTKLAAFIRTPRFRPALAFVIKSLLTILKREPENCIFELLEKILALDESLNVEFLPGLTAGLYSFAENCSRSHAFDADKLILVEKSIHIIERVIVIAVNLEKSQTWHTKASQPLKGLITSIIGRFLTHPIVEYRRFLLNFCSKLIDQQSPCLLDSKKPILLSLAVLITDDETKISKNDQISLQNKVCSTESDFLFNCLTQCSRRLSRTVGQQLLDFKMKIIWAELAGILILIGDDLNLYLLNESNLKLLCQSLIDSIDFSKSISELQPVVDLSRLSIEDDDCLRKLDVILQKPNDPRYLKLILSILLRCDQFDLICDYIYDRLSTSDQSKYTAAAYIMNNFLKINEVEKFGKKVLTCLLEEYVRRLMEISDDLIDDLKDDSSLRLCLQGLCLCFAKLESDGQPHLIRSLYVILRLFSLANYKVYSTCCLDSISKSLKFTSIQTLLLENFDYLSYNMIVKFKRLNCNPQLPSVLKSCLQLIDWRNLDQIKAVINQCLSILDFYQDDEENGIILATVIDCLSKFCVLCSELPIDRQIENYGDKCNQDENDCEIKPKLTWPMKTVIDILRSIRTWLSSRSSFVRNSSLECIDEGLYALRNIQDEYLPMVHQTWSSLVLRLNDSSISCRISSYQTIQREAEICSSFIRRRFESDAWPHLRKFLISRAKITKNMNVESISNRFLSDDSLRFQSILCETMIRLIAKIGYTSERILEEYRDVFWTYYAGDNEQMAMLREKVKESLKFLPQVDKTQNM